MLCLGTKCSVSRFSPAWGSRSRSPWGGGPSGGGRRGGKTGQPLLGAECGYSPCSIGALERNSFSLHTHPTVPRCAFNKPPKPRVHTLKFEKLCCEQVKQRVLPAVGNQLPSSKDRLPSRCWYFWLTRGTQKYISTKFTLVLFPSKNKTARHQGVALFRGVELRSYAKWEKGCQHSRSNQEALVCISCLS